jgi:hypothetical protein
MVVLCEGMQLIDYDEMLSLTLLRKLDIGRVRAMRQIDLPLLGAFSGIIAAIHEQTHTPRHPHYLPGFH